MRINNDYLDKGSLIDEERNVDATRFFKLLKDFIEPLWNEFTNHSKLSVISWVFAIKSDYELSEIIHYNIIEWAKNISPEGNRLKENFYTIKFMMKPLDT